MSIGLKDKMINDLVVQNIVASELLESSDDTLRKKEDYIDSLLEYIAIMNEMDEAKDLDINRLREENLELVKLVNSLSVNRKLTSVKLRLSNSGLERLLDDILSSKPS